MLQQFSTQSLLEDSIDINSTNGIIINGKKKISGPVSFGIWEKGFVVNGQKLTSDCLELVPILSEKHYKKAQHTVSQWVRKHSKFCNNKFAELDSFYTNFVTKKGFRDYEPLYKAMDDCVELFIQFLLEDIESPVVSFDSLKEDAHLFLRQKLKVLFTDDITRQKISKTQKKVLQKSKEKRDQFFIKVLNRVLNKFLVKFFVQLPHKSIKQYFGEETGVIKFGEHQYLGTFALLKQKDNVLLINSVDIDDYLLSVVRTEGWPGWPLEVNKVFAITSRTYLASKILEAHKLQRPYHIVNTIKHQTYKGHHKYNRLKQAVDETKDMFISYDGKPIVAMFDSCCGGVIPAKVSSINFEKFPYLARKKQCNYCKKCWIYSWSKEFSKTQLVDIFKKAIPSLKVIKDIKVVSRDSAGLVQRVMINSPQGKFYLTGKKMYSLFPEIKSFWYTTKRKGNHVVIQGRGYGHHVGLCQWGAWKMVQDNWNYEKILKFYYPGTELMKLSYQR